MDALGSAYKMPSLDEFVAQITREQAKLAPKGKGNKQHKDPKKHDKGDDSP